MLSVCACCACACICCVYVHVYACAYVYVYVRGLCVYVCMWVTWAHFSLYLILHELSDKHFGAKEVFKII